MKSRKYFSKPSPVVLLGQFYRNMAQDILRWWGFKLMKWGGHAFFFQREIHVIYNVCLFVLSFTSHSRIFHSHGEVTITGEGLQILTYARHSWPLSSEGSLACHTYWIRGICLWWSSPRTRDTRGCDSNTQPSACGANSLTHCA